MWKHYVNFVSGGLFVLLVVGGLVLWFVVENTPAAALAVISSMVAMFTWFQTREDKKEQAEDKQDLLNDGKLTRTSNSIQHKKNRIITHGISKKADAILDKLELLVAKTDNRTDSVSTQIKNISNSDFEILKELWKYINYNIVRGLLQGYVNNMVHYDHVVELEAYQLYRNSPRYQLEDHELEQALVKFDTDLQETFTVGGNLFGPTDSAPNIYKWNQFEYEVTTKEYVRYQEEFRLFLEEKVTPAGESYFKFINLLKRRNLFNKLEWPE